MGQLCSCGTVDEPQPKPANNQTKQPAAAQTQQQQQQPRNNQRQPNTQAHAARSPPGPSTSSSAGDGARFAASQHAQRRGELMAQSQAAWNRGDKAEAKRLSDEGKREGHEMERCNREAANLYFNDNNKKHGKDTIDLHGLHVDEALERLDARLTECSSSSLVSLVIIVGRGNHSKDGIRKIKPGVEKMMAEHRLRVQVDSPNAGCLTVYFNHPDGNGYMNHSSGARTDGSANECLHQ